MDGRNLTVFVGNFGLFEYFERKLGFLIKQGSIVWRKVGGGMNQEKVCIIRIRLLNQSTNH